MSNLHKSKQYDLIDMFNNTSRYLDDIFTIDNPEFEKHIPDIYLSKVLTERFSILNKIQTKEDIRLYILTLVLDDINFTFRAKVWIQF